MAGGDGANSSGIVRALARQPYLHRPRRSTKGCDAPSFGQQPHELRRGIQCRLLLLRFDTGPRRCG